MPVTITFRLNEAAKVHEVPLEELKSRIASGEIGPKSLVRDRILTNEEWWTLDNLNLFHHHSPVHHDAGPHLRRKRQLEDERKCITQIQAEWTLKVMASLPLNFIDDCLGFETFDRILSRSATIGVSRLVRCPAFGGIDGVSIVMKRDEALIVTVVSSVNPKYRLAAPVIERVNSQIPDWMSLAKRFSAEKVKRSERSSPIRSLRPPLNNWADCRAAAKIASDCRTPTLDGYTFLYSAAEAGWKTSATWHNPRHDLTPIQARLVEAHGGLLPSWSGLIFS